jgi:hypothetical protein
VVQQLQDLQLQMRTELDSGKKDEAAVTLKKLKDLMEEYGFEYESIDTK